MRYLLVICMVVYASLAIGQEQVVRTNTQGQGELFSISFQPGESFYYPLFAVWVEDSNGKYLQTLYVPNSIAKGTFTFGKIENNEYKPGPKRLPAALPYWGHKRGLTAEDGLYLPSPKSPVPDAYSGASPTRAFVLHTRADKSLPKGASILVEVNQSWDWNQYWNNGKYPESEAYKASAQPALVYRVAVKDVHDKPVAMELIGHSHYAGENGNLFEDLSTFTTAMKIFAQITVMRK